MLANEQVVDGACWRCGTTVVTRDLEQWFFRITAYADELLTGLETLTEWPEKVVVDAAQLDRPIRGRARHVSGRRAATARSRSSRRASTRSTARRSCCWRPNIRWWIGSPRESPDPDGVPRAAWRSSARWIATARLTGAIEKEGFDTGRTAINPFTGEEVPIWIANFVLAEYGTGAIMAVPAHDERDFEFARKYEPADPRSSSSSANTPAIRRRR